MHIGVRVSQAARGLCLVFCSIGVAAAVDAKHAYSSMAAIADYHLASRLEETDLARSAAPTSISGDATLLTLGSRGYDTAVKGKNGFTCLVMRSWAADFPDAEFWNPKVRAPICFNPAAVHSVLPGYLERTHWVLAGVSKSDMIARTQAALAAKTWSPPAPGAMCFMMSKQGYLSDAGSHWHPHLMFFVPRTDDVAWGANLEGSPIISFQSTPEPVTTFLVPVNHWSDGTAAIDEKH